jgi:hypothetical protein
MDPRTGLDNTEKRKFLHYRDSNSDPSVVKPIASRYTYYAIPTISCHNLVQAFFRYFVAMDTARNKEVFMLIVVRVLMTSLWR